MSVKRHAKKKQWSDGGAKRAFDQIKIDLNSSTVLTNIANSLKTEFGTTNICNSDVSLNGTTPNNLSKLNMLKKYGIGYKKSLSSCSIITDNNFNQAQKLATNGFTDSSKNLKNQIADRDLINSVEKCYADMKNYKYSRLSGFSSTNLQTEKDSFTRFANLNLNDGILEFMNYLFKIPNFEVSLDTLIQSEFDTALNKEVKFPKDETIELERRSEVITLFNKSKTAYNSNKKYLCSKDKKNKTVCPVYGGIVYNIIKHIWENSPDDYCNPSEGNNTDANLAKYNTETKGGRVKSKRRTGSKKHRTGSKKRRTTKKKHRTTKKKRRTSSKKRRKSTKK